MRMILLAVVLALGCGKSAKEQLQDDIEKDQARGGLPDPTVTKKEEPKVIKGTPDAVKKDKPPPDPEPTTPEEIDTARKKAMIDGRDKDVVRFCEMGKFEEKGDAQVMLGCTLAACRLNDADKAKAWAKSVAKSKPLYDQAIKTCMANKVVL